MPTFFQRPENALKRAKEFIAVGKQQQALDALYDVIKSKKHRTWQKIHEPIMEQYLELCVDLKKSHVAKEGLYQYKNICQQINIRSLEEVVRKYLALAEEKTEAARQQSHQAVVDVDDLDIIISPENLLLSAVSGEDTQDRTDRAILTPWVKFLWESYRQCLDLLRNNNSVEKLYQEIAQHAFKFCLKYTRKTEFRKLCDNLRVHLNHVYKHQHQQRAINLNNPESQAMHLETRLAQLDSAIQMELWQEAFKAVEDIHNLIILAKKSPKPSLMANYYTKLGLVFWQSGCHMFHACAWHRLFTLSREQRKNLSQEELQRLSSRVLCATLAVPIPPSRNQIDAVLELDEATAEKQRRLAVLLGLQNPPNRASLVKDLFTKYNIMAHVPAELASLYCWLEVDFHPLKLAARVQSSLEFIAGKEELAQYVPEIQKVTITRLIKQVAQVYRTIKFSRLAELAPFVTEFELERIIVECGRTLELQVRLDHRTQSVSFGTNLGVAQKEDVAEGPYIQSMPSETIRNQMTRMAVALHEAVDIITPTEQSKQRDDLRQHIVRCYRQTANKEHEHILLRKLVIEERKEQLESMNMQREQSEQMEKEQQQRQVIEAEMARLAREAEERERQRVREEEKDIQRKQALERLEQLKQTPIGAKMIAEMKEEQISELNMDEIMQRQLDQLEKEKREQLEKLRQQEKKVDYSERARRVEELPLLEAAHQKERAVRESLWNEQETERIARLKEERVESLTQRDRLEKMTDDQDEFLNNLQEARMSVYSEKLDAWEAEFQEERTRRLAERRAARREDRMLCYYREKEEKERQLREEEEKRQREEEERREREEYEERMRELAAVEERKRVKEEELERKRVEQEEREREQRMERESASRARDDAEDRRGENAGRWQPPSSGGWREREKQKEMQRRPADSRDGPLRESNRDEDTRRGFGGSRMASPPRSGGGGGGWRDSPSQDSPRGGGRDFGDDRRAPSGMSRDDRGMSRDFDDRDAAPRGGGGGGWRNESKDAGRDDGRPRGGGTWGRDDRRDDRGPSRNEGWGRRDDGPRRDDGAWPRRDEGGPRRDEPWSRRDDGGTQRDERGPMRRDEGPPRRDDGPPQRDEMGPPSDDRWRKDDPAPIKKPSAEPRTEVSEDGWETVNKR